jgi:hypothetical protein
VSDFDFAEWAEAHFPPVPAQLPGTPHRPEQVDDFGAPFDEDIMQALDFGAPATDTEARADQQQRDGAADRGGGGGSDWPDEEVIDWSHAPPDWSDWDGYTKPGARVREAEKGQARVRRVPKLTQSEPLRTIGARPLVFPVRLELTERRDRARMGEGALALRVGAQLHAAARELAGGWTDAAPEVRDWADDNGAPPPPEWSGGGGMPDDGDARWIDLPLPDPQSLPDAGTDTPPR